MKKLIFRKFIIDVLIFFTSSILIMGLIVWTLQAVNYFDFVSEDGHGLKVYFAYTVLNFPKIIHRIFPFMFFISLFYTLIRYELNNELNIFWINGITKISFIKVIIFFSIVTMFFQIFLGSYLSPMTQLKGRNYIKNSNVDFFTSLIKEGKFINAVKGLTIFIEKSNEENFENIFIDDSSKSFSRIIYAKSGIIVSDKKKKKFVLFNGKVININSSRINTFEFDQIDFNLESFSSNTITTPKIQETASIKLLSCVFYKTFSGEKNCRYVRFLPEAKQELLKRFYKPLYIPVIALLCSFLLISGNYKPNYSNVKKYLFLGILLTLIVSETSLRYSTESSFAMTIYFLTPFLLFFSFYISIHKKVKNV
jgi:lipopolysaccharide export system permease protein